MSSDYDDRLFQNQDKSSDDRWLGCGCRGYPRAHWRLCVVLPRTKKEAPSLEDDHAPGVRGSTAPISPFKYTAYVHSNDYAGTPHHISTLFSG